MADRKFKLKKIDNKLDDRADKILCKRMQLHNDRSLLITKRENEIKELKLAREKVLDEIIADKPSIKNITLII